MKLSEKKFSHIDWNVCGRANLSRTVSCDQFPMSWGPSKILQPLTGGCGTRLSIRQQDPNNYSDTETRCLVYPAPSAAFLNRPITDLPSSDFQNKVFVCEAKTRTMLGNISSIQDPGRWKHPESAFSCRGKTSVRARRQKPASILVVFKCSEKALISPPPKIWG